MSEESRRLNPLMVVLGSGENLRNVLLPLGIAVFGGSRSLRFTVIALLIAVPLALIPSWLRWWRFTYRVTAEELVIEDGIFTRRRRSIPRERVQDVSIERGALARLLGLAVVKVETGSGGADEGYLNSVRLREAERLRGLLAPGAVGVGEEEEAAPPIFAMSTRRVLLHGMFNFSLLLWAFVIFDIARRVADAFDVDLVDMFGSAERQVAAHWSIALAGVLLLGIALLGMLVGVVRSLLSLHGFALRREGERFRIGSGLIGHKETLIGIARIRLALIRQGVLTRLFGWYTLDLQTLGGSDGLTGRLEAAPLARMEEAEQVIAATGLPLFAAGRLDPVAPAHGFRLALRRSALVIVPVLPVAWFFPLALLGLLLLLPVWAIAFASGRAHRFAVEHGVLHVAQHFVFRRAWIVPVESVESITLNRGPIQRWLGLVTLYPDTAGAAGNVPEVVDVAFADALALARRLTPSEQASA